MMPRETIAFPMVALVEGGVTTDGEQVLLQLMTVEDGPIRGGARAAAGRCRRAAAELRPDLSQT
jgi:hypothetical protein